MLGISVCFCAKDSRSLNRAKVASKGPHFMGEVVEVTTNYSNMQDFDKEN